MATGHRGLDEPIEHDQLAEEADLLTTLETNARVRELLRDTVRELAEREQAGATDLELTLLREKVARVEEAVKRYR